VGLFKLYFSIYLLKKGGACIVKWNAFKPTSIVNNTKELSKQANTIFLKLIYN